MEAKTVKTLNAGTIEIVEGDSEIRLYPHQVEAFSEMTKQISESGRYPFKGLLILPTGGGKTLTAARWISENVIDKGVKVLWLAHRHELLTQAKGTFCNLLAYRDVFKTRKTFSYRIISGIHDKPVNVRPYDDIIFASKDSVVSELAFGMLTSKWLVDTEELFLVIDEAHHAAARTYREFIGRLESRVKRFRMLGLTATPFRTEEEIQGSMLQRIFPDNVVYKVDLLTLIRQAILSEPVFEEVKTGVDLEDALDERQIEMLQSRKFDLASIGSDVAEDIAENGSRNRLIVQRYVDNKERYGKTIVFAVNVNNALALNALFVEKGVRSDLVVSNVRDETGRISISSKMNKEKIARFRKGGDIDVLISVDILTEGTDIPDVQTVFLTRPTMSTILMTQMMGRGLRGEKAGGTKQAYIVSFIDDWNDKIVWTSPEKLFIDDVNFNVPSGAARKYLLRLVSIKKIEEFAVLNDKIIDPERKAMLEGVDFMKRMPIGFYQFKVPERLSEDEIGDRSCEVLVYDDIKKSYEQMFTKIPELLSGRRETLSQKDEEMSEDEMRYYVGRFKETYFPDEKSYIAFDEGDIRNILRYYIKNGVLPKLYQFVDRERYNIDKVARYIIDSDFGQRREAEYLRECFERESDGWQAFFNYDFKIFKKEVDNAKNRINYPEQFCYPGAAPRESHENRHYEDMPLSAIREVDPHYEAALREKVFEKSKDSNGEYCSASGEYRSRNKRDFEVDHIIPLSRGGKTVLDNLQLLTVRENRLKGNALPGESESGEQNADEKVSTEHKISRGRLRVTIGEGRVIQETTAAGTLCKVISIIGIARVKGLGIGSKKYPLVASFAINDYYKEISDVYWEPGNRGTGYVFTNCDTETKKKFLDQILVRLKLDWKVEIV